MLPSYENYRQIEAYNHAAEVNCGKVAHQITLRLLCGLNTIQTVFLVLNDVLISKQHLQQPILPIQRPYKLY